MAYVCEKYRLKTSRLLQFLVQNFELAVFFRQFPLTRFQSSIGPLTLQLMRVRFGMHTNPRQQFDSMRQFDHVIISSGFKRGLFDCRLIFAGKDDDRNRASERVVAVVFKEVKSVHPWHYEILQDHRWANFYR